MSSMARKQRRSSRELFEGLFRHAGSAPATERANARNRKEFGAIEARRVEDGASATERVAGSTAEPADPRREEDECVHGGVGNDTDCYVVPNSERGEWDVVKEERQRASVQASTKRESEGRARKIIDDFGGGKMHVADGRGKFNEASTQAGPKQGQGTARDRR